MNSGQRTRGDHVAHDFNRVVVHDTDVGEATFADPLDQCTDASRKNLDAKEVDVWPCFGDRDRRLAHAAADFKHGRRVTLKRAGKIDPGGCVRNAERRQQLNEGLLLRSCDATASQREAANMWMCRIVGGRALRILGRGVDARRVLIVQAALLGAITPLVGELALAL